MTTFVSQQATNIGLKWYPSDPVNLQWRVAGVDWSGAYIAKLRQYGDPLSTEIATFTVVAVYDIVNLWTTFTVTLAAAIPEGQYYWSCKQTGGVTRFSGAVSVGV